MEMPLPQSRTTREDLFCLPVDDTRQDERPHVLRHTFSVTAVQKGISLPALQRLLGHDHLATTEIYLNLSPEHVIKEFMEKW